MSNHEETANSVPEVIEKDLQFSAEERTEALLLTLQVLGDEELLEQP